jgi:prevent-host-death family protein
LQQENFAGGEICFFSFRRRSQDLKRKPGKHSNVYALAKKCSRRPARPDLTAIDTGLLASHDHYDHNGRYGFQDLPSMITETSAVAFRQNLGEMINQVQYRKDSVVITKDGRPVAALIDARLFERIRRMQERFDALSARVAEAYAELPENDGMAEIKRVASAVRTELKAERARPKASTKRKKG